MLGPDLPFSKVLGKVIFLAGCTRPDIIKAVNALARHTADPRESHWRALRWLLRYLRGTTAFGLRYHGPQTRRAAELQITGYADASYILINMRAARTRCVA
jgi:hypothetical protein